MQRTRAYRRNARKKAILRKKRISKCVYGNDWYQVDGKYSKGKIHCSCKMCKYGRHFGIPLLYEKRDEEYVKICLRNMEC